MAAESADPHSANHILPFVRRSIEMHKRSLDVGEWQQEVQTEEEEEARMEPEDFMAQNAL